MALRMASCGAGRKSRGGGGGSCRRSARGPRGGGGGAASRVSTVAGCSAISTSGAGAKNVSSPPDSAPSGVVSDEVSPAWSAVIPGASVSSDVSSGGSFWGGASAACTGRGPRPLRPRPRPPRERRRREEDEEPWDGAGAGVESGSDVMFCGEIAGNRVKCKQNSAVQSPRNFAEEVRGLARTSAGSGRIASSAMLKKTLLRTCSLNDFSPADPRPNGT